MLHTPYGCPEPNSLVHSSYRAKVSRPTLGRTALSAFAKCAAVATGLRSAFVGTCKWGGGGR